MRSDINLVATVCEGSILVRGKGATEIQILGASLPISPYQTRSNTGWDVWLDSFLLAPKCEQTGIIILRLKEPRTKNDSLYGHFFLEVSWKENMEGPYLNLKDEWVPPADRIPQFIDGHIRIIIDDVLYSTDRKKDEACYISDGDLICRYLIGEATAEDVKAAASELVKEDCIQGQLSALKFEVTMLQADLERARETRNTFENIATAWSNYAQALENAIKAPWRRRKSLMEAAEKIRPKP